MATADPVDIAALRALLARLRIGEAAPIGSDAFIARVDLFGICADGASVPALLNEIERLRAENEDLSDRLNLRALSAAARGEEDPP